MMNVISSLLICNSILFMFMKHPLSMGLSLMIQSLLICLLSGAFFFNYWFSYTLFLIFLGGLLVLFIYISSLASNEMFQFSTKLISFLGLMFFLIFIISNLLNEESWNSLNSFSWTSNSYYKNFLINIYSNINFQLMLFMVIYLLVCLLVVVNITKFDKSPLRLLK
uniref:NADH-ubiquinone oxidoreductase chain 6 n=2 Tax=Triops TaxID=58776 RepID=Q6DVM2_9CRUS|nr:NADH dehydrogenase subunit 6 [Triops longicaudatus]AAT69277.1 NADH dehydrogenase subunit 6 [Triops longicaudatus]AJD07297.1 NADH dehydrogenase subunit 6 [Triops longicaudatus]AJD07310.1 NADH dehydrogenase subunit 6 [Triops newberryi]